MDSNSNFLKYNVFLSKYGIKANFLTYSGVLSALVNYKKCFSQNHSSKDKRAEEVKAALKSCKGTYKMLIQRIASLLTRSEGKWLTEANLFGYSSINWEKTYSFPCLCTKETKLRVFEFKFLHRRIAMNDFLFRIGLLPTNLCPFCKQVSETTMHLFWSCDYSQILWKEVLAWMEDTLLLPKETVLSCSMCLGLVVNETYDLLIEHLFLVARYHIYASTRKNMVPKLQTFIELTANNSEVEKRGCH